MRGLGKTILAGVLVCASCVASAAWGGISRGGLHLEPSLKITFVGDDNVYHTKRDKESAFGSWIFPRLALDYGRGSLRAEGDLGVDARLYTGASGLDEVYYFVSAELEYQTQRGLTLSLSNLYAPQPVSLGRPTDDSENLLQSNTLIAEARYRREFKRSTALELGLQGSWFTSEEFDTVIDLHDDGVLEEVDDFHADYLDFSAFLEGQYSLGRRALLFARGRARVRDYDEIPRGDYTEYSAVVGARTDWGRRIRLEISFGYGAIDYEHQSTDSRFVGRLTLDYQLPRGWAIEGSVGRTLTSQAVGVDFDETFARLGVEKLLGSRTRAYLGLWWNSFDSAVSGQRENSSTAVEFSLRRQLTRRIEAELGYRYWSNGGDHSADDFHQNRVTLAFTYRY